MNVLEKLENEIFDEYMDFYEFLHFLFSPKI